MDKINVLAEMVATSQFSDLPSDVVEFQKMRILDNLACSVAGVNASGVDQARQYALANAGGTGGFLYGVGREVSLPGAAFANSVAARAYDFCDAMFPGYHPSSTDIPVALTVGNSVGASAEDIILALAVGQDLACRINLACTEGMQAYNGFDSNILAYLSGAAVAAKLLGLDSEGIRNAMGHALNQAAGSFQSNIDKAMGVRFIQGFASRGAVDAALLAKANITGPHNVLNGMAGFFNLYARRVLHPEFLTDLGKTFYGREQTIYKFFPSCGVTQALTAAAFDIREQLNADIDRCDAITVHISGATAFVCGQPFEAGENPDVNAMFSAEFVVVNALRNGTSTLAQFFPDAVRERAQDRLFEKVKLVVDGSFGNHQCRIVAQCGEDCFEANAEHTLGMPECPANFDQLADKFKACAALAAPLYDPSDLEALPNLIANLGQTGVIDKLFEAVFKGSQSSVGHAA